MQLITFENIFLLGMGFVFLSFFLGGPILLIMHFLMPRAVLDTYFKPPYFREFELGFFTGPFAPLRTTMFMWVLAYPQYGKKRKLTEAYLLAPGWYRTLSKIVSLSIILDFFGIISIASFFGIHMLLFGQG